MTTVAAMPELDDWDALLDELAWPNSQDDGHEHVYNAQCFCLNCGADNDTPAHSVLCLDASWHLRPGDIDGGIEI